MTNFPHDGLFKATFSQIELAAAELRSVLPEALSKRIDWSSLVVEPGSYVDEQLKERQSDLLYSALLDGQPAQLYLLFEHQSEPDPTMPFRLLRYMVRIWEKPREPDDATSTLKPIVTVVLSHSAGGWKVATDFHGMFDFSAFPSEVREFVPQFRYIVDDLAEASDAALRARLPEYLRLVFVLFRDLRVLAASVVLEKEHQALLE